MLHQLNEIASASPLLTIRFTNRSYCNTTQPNKQKARSLDEILRSIGLITDVKFNPFQPESKQAPRSELGVAFRAGFPKHSFMVGHYMPVSLKKVVINARSLVGASG
jgi:hypothetical protein